MANDGSEKQVESGKGIGRGAPGRKRAPGCGRKPGVPNKVNGEVREIVKDIVARNRHHAFLAMRKLRKADPKAFLEVWIKLADPFMPKKIEVGGWGGGPVRHEHTAKPVTAEEAQLAYTSMLVAPAQPRQQPAEDSTTH